MTSGRIFTVACVASLALGFVFGAAIGGLHMKWTMRDELSEARRDARKCCEAAYVLNKYHSGQLECPLKPAGESE